MTEHPHAPSDDAADARPGSAGQSRPTDDGDALFRARQRRSRMVLVGLFALFGFPLLLATWWLDQVRTTGEAMGNTSHGELIVPALPLADVALESRSRDDVDVATTDSPTDAAPTRGEPFGIDDLRGHWTLFYVADGDCDAICEQNLYHMRQVRLALNHRKDRVQRAALVDNEGVLDQRLLDEHRGLVVLTAPDAARERLVAQIRGAEQALDTRSDSIYLVDPFGNLMMRFPADLDPRSMLDDLKHLLKVSRIG